MSKQKFYEVGKVNAPRNFYSEPEHFDYMWGSYRWLTKEEMESIPEKEIFNGIGSGLDWTYNCSLRKLLSKKFGKIEKADVVKLETLGFAIREIDYKKEREAFWEKEKKEKIKC